MKVWGPVYWVYSEPTLNLKVWGPVYWVYSEPTLNLKVWGPVYWVYSEPTLNLKVWRPSLLSILWTHLKLEGMKTKPTEYSSNIFFSTRRIYTYILPIDIKTCIHKYLNQTVKNAPTSLTWYYCPLEMSNIFPSPIQIYLFHFIFSFRYRLVLMCTTVKCLLNICQNRSLKRTPEPKTYKRASLWKPALKPGLL